MVAVRFAWGKTDVEGCPSHHLAHHSMDVAAVLEALLYEPAQRARAEAAAGGPLDEAAIRWLGAFAFLHDIGKLSPAFQAKAWPEAERGRTASHLDEGRLWFDRLLDGRTLMDSAAEAILAPLCEAGEDDCLAWFEALLAHHGRPIDLDAGTGFSDPRTVFHDRPGYDWRAEDRRMGEALRLWFPDPVIDPALLQTPRFAHHFAGLLALADWIGSDETAFPHVLPFDPNYADRARMAAPCALRRIGLSAAPWPSKPPSFAALTGHPRPRGAQATIQDVPLDAPLTILEAETGSGKTEAALAHFVRLRDAGLVDGLYFAVPTRAAASQLHRRVHEAMARIGASEAVLAVPGLLRAGTATGTKLPGFRVLWDDERTHWAAEHPTRFLAATVAVGTVDQALLAALRVKHAPLRAAALARSLLVIDEVHASDAYMNAIARRLVADHIALGGRALLMSATLGGAQRAAWLEQPVPPQADAVAAPYPAVWHTFDPQAPICPEGDARQKTVVPQLIPTMDAAEAAARAIKAAEKGARVLVIRNTVDMAVATMRAVAEARPDLCLQLAGHPAIHHSRFAAEDRRALDAAVEAALSPTRGTGGLVVVGTQTLEQSLDIDADLLITDLCPVDVLLQRVGRLHRHTRVRPVGFETARVDVLAPEGGLARLASGPAFENGLGAWSDGTGLGGIYLDLRAIERTQAMIVEDTAWRIPEDNRRLVEGATHPEALASVEAALGWTTYGQRIDAKGLAEGRAGEILTLDRGAPFPSRFPDADEAVQTRLGARGPSFRLPPGTVGPFGHEITTIAPPAHWCHGLVGDEPVTVTEEGDCLRLVVGETVFGYGPEGLAKSPE